MSYQRWMSMELLEWNKLKSNIVFSETKKKFYKKYHYSIRYFCPGGRWICKFPNITDDDLANYIQTRKDFFSQTGSSRWRFAKEQLDQIRLEQLNDIHNCKQYFGDQVKVRVEEPHITIYTVTEKDLLSVANQYLKCWIDRLEKVTAPKNEEIKQLLDSGSIVLKTDIGYRYKFICKEGICENKRSLCTYLEQLEDQVKISPAVWNVMRNHSMKYVWHVWFYANDPDLKTMLNIIEPNFVTNIHELIIVK